jgi:glyoxylate utilization-related uncharacterized protein
MPFGLRFRKAILWHEGRAHEFRKVRESRRDREGLRWTFAATSGEGSVEVDVDGSGISLHRLPYVKTDCSSTFEVSNNSRARAQLKVHLRDMRNPVDLTTEGDAVVEMTGNYEPLGREHKRGTGNVRATTVTSADKSVGPMCSY